MKPNALAQPTPFRIASRISRSARFHLSLLNQLGLAGWISLQLNRRGGRLGRLLTGNRLWSRYSNSSVLFRPGTSDLSVFSQIFIEREYSCLDHLKSPKLIVDCGANVGYSSAYFLSRFRDATVIAIEPESGNFAALNANVSKYGARIKTIKSGLWSKSTGLKIEKKGFRDEREWAFWVRECKHGEPADITAISIDQILADSGFDRISILKIDIERSELEVFRDGYQNWLSKCDAIVIELHDEECETVFHKAIEDQGFDVTHCGELTVCIRDPRIAIAESRS